MQEDVDHDNDENERFDQGVKDFVDAFGDGKSGVERDGVFKTRRKALLGLGHQILGALSGLDGVGTGKLVNGDDGGRLAVEAALQVVELGAQLDACDIFEAHDGAIGIGANDDLGELLFGDQAAFGDDRIGIFLAWRNRFATDLSRGIYGVLGFQGGDDFRYGDLQLGKLIGIQPEAHGVLTRPKNGDAGDAVRSREGTEEINVGVVGQELRVVPTVR